MPEKAFPQYPIDPKTLAEYLTETNFETNGVGGTRQLQYLEYVTELGGQAHLFVCKLPDAARDLYRNAGIATTVERHGNIVTEFKFIPLERFKPEHQKRILEEVVRSRDNDFTRMRMYAESGGEVLRKIESIGGIAVSDVSHIWKDAKQPSNP